MSNVTDVEVSAFSECFLFTFVTVFLPHLSYQFWSSSPRIGYVCTSTGPPVLSPIREDKVMHSKSLTQGDCSRMSAGGGNRTYALVQALDYKSNSLPLTL